MNYALLVGDRVTYTRTNDGTRPTGTVSSISFDQKLCQVVHGTDVEVAVRVELDRDWLSHVGHPVTIDGRRLELIPTLTSEQVSILEGIPSGKIHQAVSAVRKATKAGHVIVAHLDGEDSSFSVESPSGVEVSENPEPYLPADWYPAETWNAEQMRALGFAVY